jgi:hypothetical protein
MADLPAEAPQIWTSAIQESQATAPRNGGVMPEHTPGDAAINRLLAAIPADVYARLGPHLEPASLALGEVIYEANDALTHVYFPTTAIVSLLYTMEDGASAEMGVVGCDGVVGIARVARSYIVPVMRCDSRSSISATSTNASGSCTGCCYFIRKLC